jgi:hypothetical protein
MIFCRTHAISQYFFKVPPITIKIVFPNRYLIALPGEAEDTLNSKSDPGVGQSGVVSHRVDVLLQVRQNSRRRPLHRSLDVLNHNGYFLNMKWQALH